MENLQFSLITKVSKQEISQINVKIKFLLQHLTIV